MTDWISVEDELPPRRTDKPRVSEVVLACDKWMDYHMAEYDYGIEEWTPDDGTQMISRITHWMPLPEPPEVES